MSYQFNEQFNNQFSAYTQQFTAAAARVNRLALENAESVFGVQLRTLEKNFEATTGFLGEMVARSSADRNRYNISDEL